MAAGEPTSIGSEGPGSSDHAAHADEVASLLSDLRSCADRLTTVAPAGIPVQELGPLIQQIEATRAVLDSSTAAIIGQFDADGGAAYDGLGSTRSWLQQHAQMSSATAARRVRVARSLRHLPDVADRCRRGRLSADQADVFARNRNERTMDAMEQDESTLADLAEKLRPDDFAREMRGWAEMVDTDGAEPEPGHRGRSFTFVQTLDDSWTGRLDLGAADGALVDSAVNAMAESLWRSENRADESPRRSRAQLRADALVELVRRGCGRGTADSPAVVPTLHLVIDAGDLEGGRGADMPAGNHLDPTATDRLLCDGSVVGVVRDRHSGAVLDWGRKRRLVTRTQRSALSIRDGGCSFPGCDAPPADCDAHHMTPWRDGGPSDMSNLTLACWSTHHRLVHEEGWMVKPDDHGMPHWFRPDGTPVDRAVGWPPRLVQAPETGPPEPNHDASPPERDRATGPPLPELDESEMTRRARERAYTLRCVA